MILTVVGTNIALGAFLWLVTDARFSSMESRFTSIESRLSNIESVLMSGAGAPAATDGGGAMSASGALCAATIPAFGEQEAVSRGIGEYEFIESSSVLPAPVDAAHNGIT